MHGRLTGFDSGSSSSKVRFLVFSANFELCSSLPSSARERSLRINMLLSCIQR